MIIQNLIILKVIERLGISKKIRNSLYLANIYVKYINNIFLLLFVFRFRTNESDDLRL